MTMGGRKRDPAKAVADVGSPPILERARTRLQEEGERTEGVPIQLRRLERERERGRSEEKDRNDRPPHFKQRHPRPPHFKQQHPRPPHFKQQHNRPQHGRPRVEHSEEAEPAAAVPAEAAAKPRPAHAEGEPGAKRNYSRKIYAQRVRKKPLEIPEGAMAYFFEDFKGQRLCWRPSSLSASEFIESSGLRDADYVFVPLPPRRFRVLRVHVPVMGMYYLVKTFKSRGASGWNLRRMLADIETALHAAVAYHLRTNLLLQNVRLKDVMRQLRSVAVCKVRVHENSVFVDLQV